MKFSFKAFFSKCDQIRSFLLIWSHLLKKSLMENFIVWEFHIQKFVKAWRLPFENYRLTREILPFDQAKSFKVLQS